MTSFNQTHRKDIDALRIRLRGVQDKLAEVEVAPVDRATLKARIDAYVDAETQHAQSMLHFGNLTSVDRERGGTVRIGLEQVLSLEGATSPMDRHPIGILALLTGAAQIKKRLLELAPPVPTGLSDTDRAAAIANLEAELRDLEVAEELAIRALEEAGKTFARRGDASPAIVLAAIL